VRPELVAEVKYLTWTEDNLLRQASDAVSSGYGDRWLKERLRTRWRDKQIAATIETGSERRAGGVGTRRNQRSL
jgi:ATP-dependent DNA ligase